MCSSSASSERAVDPGERLVEEEEPRLEHQRAGELEKLSLPARERPGVVARLRGQPEDVEQLGRPRAGALLRAPPHRPQRREAEPLARVAGWRGACCPAPT